MFAGYIALKVFDMSPFKASLFVSTLLSLPILAHANEQVSELDSCYKKEGSPFIQKCIYEREVKESQAFQKARSEFLASAKETFSGGDNEKYFSNLEEASNTSWQASLANQCALQALFFGIKDSYAYTIEYGSCRVKLYQERISYLKHLAQQG